jgi:O-antigen/teichoic acid export membrane protein
MDPSWHIRLWSKAWASRQKLLEPGLMLTGQGLQSAANFLIGALIGRFASVSALGEYALGMTVVTLAASFADALVSTPFTYAVIQRKSLRAQHAAFGTALLATLALGLAGGLVFGAVSTVLPGLASLIPALPVAMLLSLTRELMRRRYYAYAEPGRALMSDVVTVVTQLAVIGWLIHAHRFDPAAAFWAVAVSCGLAMVVGMLDLRDHIQVQRHLLLPYIRRFVRYGRWLAIGGLCQMVALQSFSWFLFLTSDARATGAFTACVAISSLPNPLLIGLTNYARPALIRAYAVRGWPGLVSRTMRLGGVFVGPVVVFALASAVAGESALRLVYGPNLLWAQGALVWTSVALVAVAVAAPLQLAMLAIEKPRAILYFHLGELVASYLIAFPLVVRFALEGAAIGYFVTTLSGAAVLAVLFGREFGRDGLAGNRAKVE